MKSTLTEIQYWLNTQNTLSIITDMGTTHDLIIPNTNNELTVITQDKTTKQITIYPLNETADTTLTLPNELAQTTNGTNLIKRYINLINTHPTYPTQPTPPKETIQLIEEYSKNP